MESIRLVVSGRVQGVGFRAWVSHHARLLGIAGSVRNLPDGRVEIEAAGEPAEVERFRIAVRSGPPGARVHDVSEQTVPALSAKGFEVRY